MQHIYVYISNILFLYTLTHILTVLRINVFKNHKMKVIQFKFIEFRYKKLFKLHTGRKILCLFPTVLLIFKKTKIDLQFNAQLKSVLTFWFV